MLDYAHLAALAAVIRTGSFERAAQRQANDVHLRGCGQRLVPAGKEGVPFAQSVHDDDAAARAHHHRAAG